MFKLFILFLVLVPSSIIYAKDLGTLGNTYKIAERDILEEVKERASNVDWGKLRDTSIEDLKKKVGRAESYISKASDNKTRYIDLTMKLKEPIFTRDNLGRPKVLYPKGFKFNALDYTKLKTKMYIFDATRKEEVAYFKANYVNNLEVMPIITRGNALDFGIDIKREVYILDDELKKKLDVRVTPTFVYQEKNLLRADEVYLEIIE